MALSIAMVDPHLQGGGPKFYQGYQISFGGPTKLRITKYDYEIGLRNVPGLGEWSLDFRDPLPWPWVVVFFSQLSDTRSQINNV